MVYQNIPVVLSNLYSWKSFTNRFEDAKVKTSDVLGSNFNHAVFLQVLIRILVPSLYKRELEGKGSFHSLLVFFGSRRSPNAIHYSLTYSSFLTNWKYIYLLINHNHKEGQINIIIRRYS